MIFSLFQTVMQLPYAGNTNRDDLTFYSISMSRLQIKSGTITILPCTVVERIHYFVTSKNTCNSFMQKKNHICYSIMNIHLSRLFKVLYFYFTVSLKMLLIGYMANFWNAFLLIFTRSWRQKENWGEIIHVKNKSQEETLIINLI